jgi:hypothetical protein
VLYRTSLVIQRNTVHLESVKNHRVAGNPAAVHRVNQLVWAFANQIASFNDAEMRAKLGWEPRGVEGVNAFWLDVTGTEPPPAITNGSWNTKKIRLAILTVLCEGMGAPDASGPFHGRNTRFNFTLDTLLRFIQGWNAALRDLEQVFEDLVESMVTGVLVDLPVIGAPALVFAQPIVPHAADQ